MASSIVTSAAQKIGELMVEEAKYLYAVGDKLKSLQNELEWMECFLGDADNREHQEKIVRKWVSEIRDIAYEAEDIIERFLHEISHQRENGIWNTVKWFSCCAGDALTLHFVGTSIDELKDRISDLIPRMQMYGIRSNGGLEGSKNSTAMREQRRTYSHTEENPVGLDEHEKVLVQQILTNKEASVIGISGMGGLGKTTLAREVFSNNAIEERFQNSCAWVYISKEFNRRNVFEEILIGLTCVEDDEKRKKIRELGNEELPRKICEVLKEKKCFIVIDDIWYEHSWDTLKPAFETIKSSGSKILITTRNEGLVQYADAFGYSHRSDVLGADDSWKLLQQKAFPKGKNEVDAEVKAELEILGKQMVKHCNGLPLAIIALGGILEARRTVDEWKIVQKNISSYLFFEMGEGNGNGRVSPVLELSYNDLPFYLKPCFLYMGCFPEDSEIQTQRLYHLWEAEGLITETEITGISLDDIAESYLNVLVQRCMVQVSKRNSSGRIQSCRLHDIMRDMCLQKCKEVNFLSVINYGSIDVESKRIACSSLRGQKLRRCAVYLAKGNHDESLSASQLDEAASLRSLLVFPCGLKGCEVHKLFSRNMIKIFSLLRVLDLQGSGIKYLPTEIRFLIHLRYLSLRDTKIGEFPLCVYQFKYLETLDMRCSGNRCFTLYSDFQKLESLRYFYLPVMISRKNSEKMTLSADQLRQMEIFKNFDLEACKMEDIGRMIKLRIFTIAPNSKFKSREDLEVILGSPAVRSGHLMNTWKSIRVKAKFINEKPTILLEMNKYLEGLVLYDKIDAGDVDIFPRNLKMLEMNDCEIDLKRFSELEKLPHLEQLDLCGKVIAGTEILRISAGAFPKLIKLCVQNSEVKEIVIGEGALLNLKKLHLWCNGWLEKKPEGLPSSVVIDSYMSYYEELEAPDEEEDDEEEEDNKEEDTPCSNTGEKVVCSEPDEKNKGSEDKDDSNHNEDEVRLLQNQ